MLNKIDVKKENNKNISSNGIEKREAKKSILLWVGMN